MAFRPNGVEASDSYARQRLMLAQRAGELKPGERRSPLPRREVRNMDKRVRPKARDAGFPNVRSFLFSRAKQRGTMLPQALPFRRPVRLPKLSFRGDTRQALLTALRDDRMMG